MSVGNRIVIELCMGSSCFARGNSSVLTELESYIEENGLEDRIELCGHLCLGLCNAGPHVKIDGVEYSPVSSDGVLDIVKEKLNA